MEKMYAKITEIIYPARFGTAWKVFPCVLPELKKKTMAPNTFERPQM